jgi:hypothetical protein
MIARWAVGLLVSLGLGYVLAVLFLRCFYRSGRAVGGGADAPSGGRGAEEGTQKRALDFLRSRRLTPEVKPGT